MTISITHAYESSGGDPVDPDIIGETKWNADHSIPSGIETMLEALEDVWQSLILTYEGAIADIPAGWHLCDGTDGTTDLRDKFIVGAKEDDGGVAKTNLTGSLLASGGSASHTHDAHASHIHTGPSHTHTGPSHTHAVSGTSGTASYPAVNRDSGGSPAYTPQMSHTHSISITSGAAGTGATGADGTGNTSGPTTSLTHTALTAVPPFYALAFIQWVGV